MNFDDLIGNSNKDKGKNLLRMVFDKTIKKGPQLIINQALVALRNILTSKQRDVSKKTLFKYISIKSYGFTQLRKNIDIIYTIKCNLKLKAKRMAWLALNETYVGSQQ